MNFRIRPIQAGDEYGLHAMRVMPGVFETVLALPDESVEKCRDFINHIIADPNEHSFVAVIDTEAGELAIGQVNLSVSARPRTRHCGAMGLLVHAGYQNCGVGTALMRAALDLADNWLLLERLELSAFCDNERAIHLYEKLGFEKEGMCRRAAIRNGAYADEYYMGRLRPGTK